MNSCMEIVEGYVGFGVTKEAAKEDAYINKCKKNIELDTEKKFSTRRNKLSPWNPKPNMLHISGVGCIVYEKGKLYNTKNGSSVTVNQYNTSIYYYMAMLCREVLSYTDITVVLRPEIDSLFKNISDKFVLIKDMNPIKLAGKENGFQPTTIYTTNENIIIGVSDLEVGMKYMGDTMYYVTEAAKYEDYIPLLSYIAYRMDIIFAEGKIYYFGE